MPKTTTVKLSIKTYQRFFATYQQHQTTLEKMGIDSFGKFFQWAANEGLEKVLEKLKKIEEG